MAAALTCGALVLICLKAVTAPAAEDKGPAGKDVFGLTKVWAVHLEIPAKEYEAMQPPAGGFGLPGGPGGPPAPRERKDARASERNRFGTQFPWAQGDLTAGGKT